MNDKNFIELCKSEVSEYVNKHTDQKIKNSDVFIVWFCKTLQNYKALVCTTLFDGKYFEITHNGDKNETYIDVYKKQDNFVVKN